jgi:sporulation protein YqfC
MPVRDRKSRVQQSFASLLDIPRDVMMDMPKITIIGDLQVFIENHRGIVEYGPTRVRVGVKAGEVEITGEDLVLRNIYPVEIVLDGREETVRWNR